MQLSEQIYLKVFIDDSETDIELKEFESLVIKQDSGLIVPAFELQLKQKNYSLYPSLLKNNTPIKIIVGKDIDSAEMHNFVVIDYNYFENGNGLNVVISGVLDINEFARIPKIRSFDGNSNEVAASIESMTMDVDFESDDSQFWLQHNISDKRFLENVIRYSYIEDEDFVLSAININKEVTLRSAKNSLSNPHEANFTKFCTGNVVENDVYGMDGFEIGSESGVWAYQFSDNRTQPILSVANRSLGQIEFNTDSIRNGKSYNTEITTDGLQFPTLLDLGNCHDKYYFAGKNNLNKSTLFYRNKVITGTSQYFFPTNELKLLDTINFKIIDGDDNLDNTTEQLSGNYILSKISMSFTVGRGFYQQFEMYRDFALDIS